MNEYDVACRHYYQGEGLSARSICTIYHIDVAKFRRKWSQFKYKHHLSRDVRKP